MVHTCFAFSWPKKIFKIFAHIFAKVQIRMWNTQCRQTSSYIGGALIIDLHFLQYYWWGKIKFYIVKTRIIGGASTHSAPSSLTPLGILMYLLYLACILYSKEVLNWVFWNRAFKLPILCQSNFKKFEVFSYHHLCKTFQRNINIAADQIKTT